MKTISLTLIKLLIIFTATASAPSAGFFLPDSINETTFRYRSVDNLIILPAIINDSIRVNLILDTGCTNIVLFGKKFSRMMTKPGDRRVEVNGLGTGKSKTGSLTLENSIRIDIVRGEKIPVVVVPERAVFSGVEGVDGVVGYEIFSRFEVEINFKQSLITFRPAMATRADSRKFAMIPLRVENSKPVVPASIFSNNKISGLTQLIIDTGSVLELLITTTEPLPANSGKKAIGRGFNGLMTGIEHENGSIHFEKYQVDNVKTAVVHSSIHHYASIGTGLLKNYVVILNYVQGYAAFQRQT